MYRTIDTSLWTDRKVREQLRPLGKLLFVYLITNSHTHVSGLYYLPELIIQHETGLRPRQLDTLEDTLSHNLFAHFDKPNELVWVVNMFNFQGRGDKNTLSAAHHLDKDVHNSPLINMFLTRYPHVRPHVKNTLSGGHPAVPLPIPHSPFPIPEPEQKKKTPLAISSPVVAPKYSDDFEAFWKSSTKRGSKVEAFREWKKLKLTESTVSAVHAGMFAWQQSEQWQDETKQPHVGRWLKRHGWEEIVPNFNRTQSAAQEAEDLKLVQEIFRKKT